MNTFGLARQRAAESIDRVLVNGIPHHTDWEKRGKRWASTYAGKRSMRNRGMRYGATEKGKANARKKSLRFYNAHKDDPAFKALHNEYSRIFRAKRKARKMTGEYTFNLIGQTITTALYAT